MRKKYYVTFGELNKVLVADSEYQACMKVFKYYFRNLQETEGWVEEDETVHNMPGSFIVSQRGFSAHEDDLVVEVDLIIRLLALSGGVLSDSDVRSNNDVF